MEKPLDLAWSSAFRGKPRFENPMLQRQNHELTQQLVDAPASRASSGNSRRHAAGDAHRPPGGADGDPRSQSSVKTAPERN